MTAKTYYIRLAALKVIAAVSYYLLFFTRTVIKLLAFVLRLTGIVIFLTIGANALFDLAHGLFLDAAVGLFALLLVALLYFGLPVLVPVLDSHIYHAKAILRRPFVVKSRLKYTLG